jgi:hypothetical protein
MPGIAPPASAQAAILIPAGAAELAPAAPAVLRWRKFRDAARPDSTPAKLRVVLACLAGTSLLWGGVAAWTVLQHASAASYVVTVAEPLSVNAEQIYRSLSDADATEAAAFLSGGLEPLAQRHRYEADVARAAAELEAATAAAGQSGAGPRLAVLSAGLPVYAGLVETARADNRLGLPLGAAYLREASGLMRATLLPAARDLYAQENARLAAADGQATGLPYLALAAAVIAALVLVASQRWLGRRTHRSLNSGLLTASIVGVLALAWLVSALTFARTELIAARDHGSAPVEAMARADIAILRAHADESLTLIDRSGDDSFQQDFASLRRALGPGRGTLLTGAATAARGSKGASQAIAAVRGAPAWFAAHRRVRALDDGGSYTAAVRQAIGSGPADSGTLFGRLDADLTGGIEADQASFRSTAQLGRDALSGLEAGLIALSLVMAAGCARGITRRLEEYR